MRPRGSIDLATLIASGGFATLLVAGIGAYVSTSNEVATRPSSQEVRQLIDDKTADKLSEINRRLSHLEQQQDTLLERLQTLVPTKEKR
jgi:hypothetical protein